MTKHFKAIGGLLLVAVAAYFGWDSYSGGPGPARETTAAVGPSVAAQDYLAAARQIVDAFEAGRGDMWIEAGGQVSRILADDSEGSRHQRFIVRLPNDHTILIAHNIDLAQRVPVRMGDSVSFYGEYEWNDRGGVIHWTHHDPRGRRDGGWIRHKNTTYR